MKRAFLALSLVAAPVRAQDAVPAPTPAVATAPAAVATPATPTTVLPFLVTKGIISSDELVGALGVQLAPEARAQLDEAVAKRNRALAKANDELNATLRVLLRETDEGLVRRADESAEAIRMERMRRLQPGRYQHLMASKKKKEKKNQ